jgi:hypothetical protein
MLDNVIVLLNLVFVRANILEILVKWERRTGGGGAGPGSPAPVPARGATGAPAGPPGWPSTTPKWLGTLQYIGTHRCVAMDRGRAPHGTAEPEPDLLSGALSTLVLHYQ